MSYSEKGLLHRLKRLGLQEGSSNYKDYEKAKKEIRKIANNSDEYEKLTKYAKDHFRCQY